MQCLLCVDSVLFVCKYMDRVWLTFFLLLHFFLLEIFLGVSINSLLNKSTSVIYVYFKFHISYLWALMRPYQFNMIWIQAFGVWGVDIENLACLLLICGDSVCLSVRICTMFDSLFFSFRDIGVSLRMFLKKSTFVIYVFLDFIYHICSVYSGILSS